MDIGDIIYLAFIAISVLAGLFGKKKKKGVPSGQKETSDFSLEDFLKKAYDLDEEVVPQQTRQNKQAELVQEDYTIKQPEEKKPYHSTYEALKKKKAQAEALSKKVNKNSPIYTQDLSKAQQEDAFEFDAEKAIIYSEILKRPEY